MADTLETRIPRTSAVTAAFATVALAVLAIVVLIAALAVLPLAQLMSDEYPEFGHLQAPFVLAALAFGLCAEVVLVVSAVLVRFIRNGRIYSAPALRLVNVLIVAFAVATLIVAAVLPANPGPPLLALSLLIGVIAGVASTLVLLMLRDLLWNAAAIRGELDEVV